MTTVIQKPETATFPLITCDTCRASVRFDHTHVAPVDDLVTCWQCAKEDQLRRGARYIASFTPAPGADPRAVQAYADDLRRGLEALTVCADPAFWADNADAGITWLLTHGSKLCGAWGEDVTREVA